MRLYFSYALFLITFLGKTLSCGLIKNEVCVNVKTKIFCSQGSCHLRGLLVDEASVWDKREQNVLDPPRLVLIVCCWLLCWQEGNYEIRWKSIEGVLRSSLRDGATRNRRKGALFRWNKCNQFYGENKFFIQLYKNCIIYKQVRLHEKDSVSILERDS